MVLDPNLQILMPDTLSFTCDRSIVPMGSKEVGKQKFNLVIFKKNAKNSIFKSNITSHSFFGPPTLVGIGTLEFTLVRACVRPSARPENSQ